MQLTLQERLDIYRKAKEDYQLNGPNTELGLCHYLYYEGLMRQPSDLKDTYPELHAQKPTDFYRVYKWFEQSGPIPERIACIDAAIKLCEEQQADTNVGLSKEQL